MFERFADEARRATAQASEEARMLGHDFIGTEHLLLGLLAGGSGLAFEVLTEMDVTVDNARSKVTERVHPYGQGSVASPPFTPLAKKALERALRQALQLKADFIGPEHLLLGLIDVPDGGGARILAELAGSGSYVREEILARLEPPSPVSPPLAAPTAALRRWVTQGRTVLTSRPGAAPPEAGASVEQAPLCPSCRSPLTGQVRYHVLGVPPGSPEPEEPEELEAAAGPDGPASPVQDRPAAAGPDGPAAKGPDRPALSVTFVSCAQCGVSLGIV